MMEADTGTPATKIKIVSHEKEEINVKNNFQKVLKIKLLPVSSAKLGAYKTIARNII